MSDSIRDRLDAALRTEPAIGDPYTRFVHRRRVSRGVRAVLGLALAAVTTLGFVRIFPGGTGGLPDDGFLPGEPPQPALEPYRTVASATLGVRLLVPSDWSALRTDETLRLGASLSAVGPPREVEVWFGELAACETDPCVPIEEAVADAADARAAGVRVTPMKVRVGSVTANAFEVRFPRVADRVAPACAGCVGIYARLGSEQVPMLVLARNREVMDASATMIDTILRTVAIR